MSAMVESGTLG